MFFWDKVYIYRCVFILQQPNVLLNVPAVPCLWIMIPGYLYKKPDAKYQHLLTTDTGWWRWYWEILYVSQIHIIRTYSSSTVKNIIELISISTERVVTCNFKWKQPINRLKRTESWFDCEERVCLPSTISWALLICPISPTANSTQR